MQLEGRQGQFVSGSVTPALADISLIVQAESGDEATKINLHTDVNGKYRYVRSVIFPMRSYCYSYILCHHSTYIFYQYF